MLRCCGSCSGKVTNAVLSIDIVSECRLKVLPMSNDEDTACNVAGKGRCHVDRFPSSQADFTQHSNIFFELGRSHRFHFDLLHLHLLLLHLLLLPSLSCLLKTQQKRGFTLSCSMFAKQAHSHSRPWSHFRPPYDAASLGPPHSWSSLSQPSSSPPGGSGPPPGVERASVSGSSPPRELGSCRPSVCPERREDKINRLPHLRIMEERGRRNEVSFIRDTEGCSPLCWDGASWLYRCCRSPCSWGGAESPCPWERCCPCRALHTKTSRTFNSVGPWGRIYREKVGIVTIKCKQQRLLGLRQL